MHKSIKIPSNPQCTDILVFSLFYHNIDSNCVLGNGGSDSKDKIAHLFSIEDFPWQHATDTPGKQQATTRKSSQRNKASNKCQRLKDLQHFHDLIIYYFLAWVYFFINVFHKATPLIPLRGWRRITIGSIQMWVIWNGLRKKITFQ